MSLSVNATFISEKCNKIRWRPDPFNNANSFLTGSWDNQKNNIRLWNLERNEEDPYSCPFLIRTYDFAGDVTELKFLNPDHFIISSSLGSLYHLKIKTNEVGEIDIVDEIAWNQLHCFKNGDASSCTSFAVYDNDIASIGEDGRIMLLTAQRQDIVRTIDDADSCSLNCIIFTKFNEILTGNNNGLMKLWDLRCKDSKPSNTFMLSDTPVGHIAPTSLTCHPTQRHMVVAGDEEGSLTVWDLRRNAFPINLLSAHAEAVTELQFHSDYPDQLFSCSNAGEVWHWSTNASAKSSTKLFTAEDQDASSNIWFTSDNIKNVLEVYAVMPQLHKPVNSIDLNRNRVLCGCDNGAIYVINNVNIYK